MKKFASNVQQGEVLRICGRDHTVIQVTHSDVFVRFVLFPTSGKVLAPVHLTMRQDMVIKVMPSHVKLVLE